MKKITLLLTMLLIGFTSHAQFPENFDDGVIPSGWTTFSGENGLGTAESWAVGGTTNPYMLVYDENAVEALIVAEEYKEQRASEYPDFIDYLDGIVKGDQAQIDKYIADCQAVKLKYPKPE